MPERLLSEPDMHFLLFDWLKLEDRLEGTGFDRESATAYLDLSRKLALEKFLPHYKKSDSTEPYLEHGRVHVLPEIGEALGAFRDLGLFGASFPENLGGMGLPYLLSSASYAWFAAANGGSIGYAMLTGANARLISTFGNEKQIETFAKPQIEGQWFGTMCLSEPQAGSGLGDIRTTAKPDGADDLGNRYRLTGNKMWISGGDQDISDNIVHLVLAKIPNENGTLPEGTKGISLFIVPRILMDGTVNDMAVAGLNHKMGNRGTCNTLLNFGEQGGATGWIVGEPGKGLQQMFMMMNEARIAVGFGGAALACRGYLLAADYARERLQGRALGQASDKPVAIIEHPDVRRMVLQARAYAEGAMALCLLSAALVDSAEQNGDDRALLELLTPVAKTFPSEYGTKANDIAIQVHGGYGYTRDFDVEQLYRDNRLNPIHEGTTGIQGMDFLGRKILKGGAGLAVLAQRIMATCARAHGTGLAEEAQALKTALSDVETTIQAIHAQPPHHRLDHATNVLNACSIIIVGWLWLDMALAADTLTDADITANANETADNFRAGKTAACRSFIWHELPLAQAMLNVAANPRQPDMGLAAAAF